MRRRTRFLNSCSPLFLQTAHWAEAARRVLYKAVATHEELLVKITEVVCQILRIPNVTAKTASSQDSVLVRIRTDDGLEGVGEADSSPEVVKAIVDAPFSHNIACGLREILLGENALETERLWQKMLRRTQYF